MLFTSSDNGLGGTLNAIAQGTTGIMPGGRDQIATVTLSNVTPGVADVGQQLWVAFGMAAGGNDDYSYVDNVQLTVTNLFGGGQMDNVGESITLISHEFCGSGSVALNGTLIDYLHPEIEAANGTVQ